MADKNTKISVELETKNAQTIKDLRDEFDKLKDELKATTLAYHQGQVSEADYEAKAQTLKERMRELKTSVENLGESLKTAKSGMAGFGQSALQTGRVVQDFVQGGIGGVLNNIEGLSQALGGGPGLAGIMTIVGVAAFIALPHIQKFLDSMESDAPKTFAEQLGELEEKVKELTSKKHKVAVDFEDLAHAKAQLDEMKQIEQEIKHLREADTSEESKQKAAVQKAIIEGGKEEKVERGLLGSGAIDKDIRTDKQVIDIQKKLSEAYQKKKDAEEKLNDVSAFDNPELTLQMKESAEKQVKQFEALLAERRKDIARKTIVDAETKRDALEKLRQAAETHPEKFEPGFQEKIEEATPEVRKFDEEQKQAEKDIEEHKKIWNRTHEKDRQASQAAEERWASEQDEADAALEQSNANYRRLKSKRIDNAKKRKVVLDRQAKLREQAIEHAANEYGSGFKHELPQHMLGMVAQGATPDQSYKSALNAVDQNLSGQGVQDHHAIATKIVDEAVKEIRKKMRAQSASGLSVDAKIMNVMQEFSAEQNSVMRKQRALEQQAEQLQRQVGIRRRKT